MVRFIGRKRQIGIGKESVAGTGVAATNFIPVMTPGFKPVSEKATDDSAYGNIDEIFDKNTTKNMTEISLEGILRDDWLGLLLLGAFGTETVTILATLGSLSGTFVLTEVVTGGTSSATGTVKRLQGSPEDTMYIEVTSGTFVTGETITGGTSSATASITFDLLVAAHIFERLNDNNHPTFTVFKKDDVDVQQSVYGMVDVLDIEAVVGDFAKFNLTMKGKKATTTTTTPVFTDSNAFLAKHANLFFADTVIELDAATATPVSRAKFTITKNLTDYQAWGDDDVDSFHNQQFNLAGDLDAIFEDVTLRDFMIDGTKKAMRIEIVNTDVTIGTTENPRIILEMSRVGFEEWDDSPDNNALVSQTLGFVGEFSTPNANTGLAILVNDRLTAY